MSERMDYKKGQDPAADSDFDAAAPFGKVRVGTVNLYCKGILRWSYLPMEEVVRIYRRMEEVRGKTGCCSNDFSIHTLIVVTKDGTKHEMKIGDGLYRHEPERLMDELKARHPQICYEKE